MIFSDTVLVRPGCFFPFLKKLSLISLSLFILLLLLKPVILFFSKFYILFKHVERRCIVYYSMVISNCCHPYTYVLSTWEKIPPSSLINVSISLLLSRSKLTVDLINVFGIQLQYLKEKIPYTRREIRVQKTSSW